MSVAPSRTRTAPPATALAIILTFAAGAADAFAFLQLGGIFTANMTGNLVLSGLTERPGYLNTLIGAVCAIAVFTIAVYLTARIAKPNGGRAGLLIVLTVAALCQAAVLGGWLLVPSSPGMAVLLPLIALSTVAMAGQTVIARRVQARSGVTTTYVTGTLTNLMADFADRKAQDWPVRIAVILALVAGALADSMLMAVGTTLAAALPLVATAVALVILARTRIPLEPASA